MIPSAPGYDARMSMAWLRTLAVIVAVAGALLLLASGAGVRLGLWTYGTGFALLRYAAYIGIAAAVLALVALFLPQGRARWIAALLVAVRITPLPAGTRIDVRSKSRVGRGDTGTNAQRVRAYLKRLN